MTQSNADLVELAKVEATPSGVAAAALGNMFAGIGVAFVVGVVLHVVGLSVEQTFKWAALSGLAAWGLIMALWFSVDEARNWWNLHRLASDLAEARAIIDEADEDIAYWRAKCAHLQQENATLRFHADNARGRNYVSQADPTDRTVGDAQKMIQYQQETGNHPSKRIAAQLWNWSTERHSQALSRLAARGIVKQNGPRCEWLLTGDDAIKTNALSLALVGQQTVLDQWTGTPSNPNQSEAGEEG